MVPDESLMDPAVIVKALSFRSLSSSDGPLIPPWIPLMLEVFFLDKILNGGSAALRYSLTIPAGALFTWPILPCNSWAGFDNLLRWLISLASLLALVRTLLPSVNLVLLPAVHVKVLGACFANPLFLPIGTPPLFANILGSLGTLGSVRKSTTLITCVSFSLLIPSNVFRRISSECAISFCCSLLYLQ